METWRGSVFRRKGKLVMAVKIAGRWRQVPTPFRPGQEKEARALLKRTRELLVSGADVGLGPTPTVRAYVDQQWIAQRQAQGVASWRDDQSRLKTHIIPAIGELPLLEVRPRHVAALVAKVREGKAAPRTVRNVYAVVRAIFRDAMIAGLCEHQPCILTHHQLGKIRDAKHGWRAGALFSADELRDMLSSPRVPEDRRVLYGLASLGCLRHGEAAGLRWGSVVAGVPAGRLIIATSYDKGTTKTDAERWMPTHRALAKLLAQWKLSGWAREFGRTPHAEDLVVPHTRPTNHGPRVTFGGMRSDHDSYKRLRIDCDALGIRKRRFHDLRRSGITLYREAGADKDILRLCTHGAPGQDVMEMYTSFGWAKLCEQILCAPFVAAAVRRRVKK